MKNLDRPTEEYNVVKIIEKRVEKFEIFLFDFINKEKDKFFLSNYNLKKKIEDFFEEFFNKNGINYYETVDTQDILRDIFNNIIRETDYSHAPNFLEAIIESNHDLDFDGCEVEAIISSDDKTIQSYKFVFGDIQHGKLLDIIKKSNIDMASIIDNIVKNEKSFKGEVISLIDETDNKLKAFINNFR